MIDLAAPAFVGCDKARRISRGIPDRSIHIEDGVPDQRARMTEDRRANRCRLRPAVLIGVVHLDIGHRAAV